jgi:hypothetical protein
MKYGKTKNYVLELREGEELLETCKVEARTLSSAVDQFLQTLDPEDQQDVEEGVLRIECPSHPDEEYE